jgi:hypothetical protein
VPVGTSVGTLVAVELGASTVGVLLSIGGAVAVSIGVEVGGVSVDVI